MDPANADIVFAGTPSSGVYFTANGGDSWSRIPTAALPAAARAESQGGGNIIAFDPTSAVVGGATQGIYASSYGVGVFHTTDGGKNWAAIPSSPATMRHMIADQTGVVWLVDNSEGSLHRFASGEWAKTGAGSGLRGVAVNPHDANAVYAIQNGALVVSNDGGKSLERTDAVLANRRRHSLASNHQRELHDCGGHRFRSVAVERPLFRRGRRRMAHESAVARRTGRVDFAKRRHRATGCQRNRQSVGRARCARRGGLGSMRVRSEPAGAISKKRRHDQRLPTHSLGLVRRLGLVGSVDGRGDVSWRRQSDRHERLFLRRRRDVDHIQLRAERRRRGNFGGCIAASSASNFLWVSSNHGGQFYTLDGGANWTQVGRGIGGETSGWPWAYYINDQMCAADRVAPHTFYVYNFRVGAGGDAIFVSRDGGGSWTRQCNRCAGGGSSFTGPISFNNLLRAEPGRAGALFFTAGRTGGPHPYPSFLYRSMDGGATWSTVAERPRSLGVRLRRGKAERVRISSGFHRRLGPRRIRRLAQRRRLRELEPDQRRVPGRQLRSNQHDRGRRSCLGRGLHRIWGLRSGVRPQVSVAAPLRKNTGGVNVKSGAYGSAPLPLQLCSRRRTQAPECKNDTLASAELRRTAASKCRRAARRR